MKMNRLVTKTIWNTVKTIQNKAKSRLLLEYEVSDAILFTRAFKKYCEKNNLTDIKIYSDGGAAANSYKYRADATVLLITVVEDGYHLTIDRMRARHISYGDYGVLKGMCKRPEESTKKWVEYPPLSFLGKKYTLNTHGSMYIHS